MDISRLVSLLIVINLIGLLWRIKIDLDMLSIHKYFMQDKLNGYRLHKVFEGNKVTKERLNNLLSIYIQNIDNLEMLNKKHFQFEFYEALRYLEVE